ncbi:MAG: sulfite exporter TauE/SafE family protein [Sulfurospirillaceae bacterium]|nr:sulfite exporter TauE/SafE family protein [Sulfurospirillaceae bacterium]MDD2827276.1 sulfite exporter TauE/SafE family protein [Sulfurospirillaceae bacterium]
MLISFGLGLIGILVGFSSGFFGIGGGTILVPILISMGYDIKTAIGISVMQMIFSSMFGSYVNHRAGVLQFNSGVFLGFGALLGATLTGPIVKTLPPKVLLIIFAGVLVLSIYKFFAAPSEPKSEPVESKFLLFVIGAAIGAIAISLGTGGAIFLTPILVGFLHWDIKKAVGTALFFVTFGSLSGFISLAMNGLVDYHAGFLVGLGSLAGVYFGVKLSHRVDKKIQKKALLILYVIMLVLTVNKIFHS